VDLVIGGAGAIRRAGPLLALVACLALALAGCQSAARGEPVALGKLLLAGNVRALQVSADGSWLAALDGCVEVKGRYLPLGTGTCDLKVIPSAGGEARVVARAVPTLAHGMAFAPEGGALAALADYDFETGAGTLLLVREGVAKEVARGVTFHGFVPGGGGALLAVSGGGLVAVAPGGEPRVVAGTAGVSSFALQPAGADGGWIGLARQPIGAGGALLGLTPELDRGRPVASRTTDYALARRGGRYAFAAQERGEAALWMGRGEKPVRVGRGARLFALAAGGEAVAWISEAAPGRQGDLQLATGVGAPARLASEVGEFRWAAGAPRLAWLEQYDPRGRAGLLGVGGPGLAPRTFGKNVSDFELSADGTQVAFLRHTVEGGYSVDLWTGSVEGEARQVARGVFGFSFSPDGRWLYYRTRCTRNGEACDLERVAPGGAAGAAPEQIAQGVKSFEFDPRDPARLLITWQRADLVALDFGVWRAGALARVDGGALPGSVRFLGPDSRRVAFAVVQPKRSGVYVAELPPAGSAGR
jgi:hypothetical protein